MLKWSMVFFLISIVAALFGFGGVSAAAADIGKILFFFFLIVAAVTLLVGLYLASKIGRG